MTDLTETSRVRMRSLTPAEAVETWDQVSLGYSPAEAIEEAERSLPFDLEQSTLGCPFHVDVPRFVQHISRDEWDAAAQVIHAAHPFPQIMGMHCHRYCESALVPGAGLTIPRPEGVRMPAWTPHLSALEWAAGRFGKRPAFRPGEPSGKRVATLGGGSASLMVAWVLRQYGHAVDIYDRETVPGGILWTGYPSFRLAKDVVVRENDPEDWGVTYHRGESIGPEALQRLVDEYDAVFVGVGRTPRRSFSEQYGEPMQGEDLEGVVTGWDVLRDLWYRKPVDIGPRVMVFGGGQTSLDVSRAARRLGCTVDLVYRRGPGEMKVGPGPEVVIRMLTAEGVNVRTMNVPKRFLGHEGRLSAVELLTMDYGEPDESGRPSVHPVDGSEEIIEVDTVVRAIGEVYDVQGLVEPLGIEVTAEGFIDIDSVSRRTAHPKVWAGGDVTAGRGNHGAAYAGMWAARAIHAYLNGRYDEWRAEAAASNDAELLIRGAGE